MNNSIKIQEQMQKPAQGASSKASRGKPKGIPSGVWKEIPLNKLRRWGKNVRSALVSRKPSNCAAAKSLRKRNCTACPAFANCMP
ncbi:hypothetical protein D9M68_283490 [compost metagenome]